MEAAAAAASFCFLQKSMTFSLSPADAPARIEVLVLECLMIHAVV